jgi:hypothetical protein
MPLYTFLHNLLHVLVQIAYKMGLQKNQKKRWWYTLSYSGSAVALRRGQYAIFAQSKKCETTKDIHC